MISQQPIDTWYGHIVASSLNNPLHWGKERSIRAHQGKIQVANVHLFCALQSISKRTRPYNAVGWIIRGHLMTD